MHRIFQNILHICINCNNPILFGMNLKMENLRWTPTQYHFELLDLIKPRNMGDITNSPGALLRYCLSTPVLARLADKTEQMWGVTQPTRTQHHDLRGAKITPEETTKINSQQSQSIYSGTVIWWYWAPVSAPHKQHDHATRTTMVSILKVGVKPGNWETATHPRSNVWTHMAGTSAVSCMATCTCCKQPYAQAYHSWMVTRSILWTYASPD